MLAPVAAVAAVAGLAAVARHRRRGWPGHQYDAPIIYEKPTPNSTTGVVSLRLRYWKRDT